jgi:hypothetical protein
MRYASLISAGVLLFANAASAAGIQTHQSLPTDTLAEVGAQTVTAQDLIERMELMPWPEKERIGDRDSAKVRALQSLVAERILATEGASRGLGSDSATLAHEKSLENLLVRDELYRREVQKKVQVTQQEVREGLVRFASQRRILMLVSRDKDDAERLSRLLRRAGRRDSVLARFRESIEVSIDSVTVNFGLLEKGQEDVVYGLTASSPVSEPIELRRIGWAVLVLISQETNSEYAGLSIPERTERISRTIRRRKEIVLAGRAAGAILAPLRAEVRPEPFELLERTLHDLLAADSISLRTEQGYRLDMVVDAANSTLGAHAGDVLVDMPGGGMTIGDVLDRFRTADLLVPALESRDFRQHLNAGVKEMVERELLAREGYRRGLANTEEVIHHVATWSNYWRAQEMVGSLLQSVRVNDEEVLEYLMAHPDLLLSHYSVNIREILSDSLRDAYLIMDKISEGGRMDNIARTYSCRQEWAGRGGESGYFLAAGIPELGVRAIVADSGRLIGPIHVRNGYSVFTLLGKKPLDSGKTINIDSLMSSVKDELQYEKGRRTLNTFLASVARGYTVTLYLNRLKTVDIAPVNVVTKRLIGFGGAVLAVPALNPLWEWARESNAVQEVLP